MLFILNPLNLRHEKCSITYNARFDAHCRTEHVISALFSDVFRHHRIGGDRTGGHGLAWT